MLAGIAALLAMVFVAYLIFRALNGNFPPLHFVFYMLSGLIALYAFIYFLSTDLSFIIKVTVSVILGLVLVLIATALQRRNRTRNP